MRNWTLLARNFWSRAVTDCNSNSIRGRKQPASLNLAIDLIFWFADELGEYRHGKLVTSFIDTQHLLTLALDFFSPECCGTI